MENKRRSRQLKFSESDKHLIIRDYIEIGQTKASIWKKHTGRNSGASQINRMMDQLGYQENDNFEVKSDIMKCSKNQNQKNLLN